MRIECVADSGAAAPVAPPNMAPGVAVRPSAGSREGRIFTSCTGAAIPNLGEQELHVVTDNGLDTTVLFQLADVSRPLMSVSAICDRGNRVMFGRNGGVIQNLETGQGIPFERQGGVYALGIWIRGPSSAAAPSNVAAAGAAGALSGFTRRWVDGSRSLSSFPSVHVRPSMSSVSPGTAEAEPGREAVLGIEAKRARRGPGPGESEESGEDWTDETLPDEEYWELQRQLGVARLLPEIGSAAYTDFVRELFQEVNRRRRIAAGASAAGRVPEEADPPVEMPDVHGAADEAAGEDDAGVPVAAPEREDGEYFDLEDDVEEARLVRTCVPCVEPSAEDVRKHRVSGHAPFRSWCNI